MTAAQKQAIEELLPRYGIDAGDQPLDLDTVFGREAPRYVEIGFGNGDALLAMASANPDGDYLGIEVYRPGVGRLLRNLAEAELTNVRVMCTDATDVLQQNIPAGSLDGLFLFFPDPWPKKRHHKRRIVNPAFAAMVHGRLKPGGRFHLATDWAPYAEHMMEVLSAAPGFENTAGTGRYAPRPGYRPLTRFEQRGNRLGHEARDLVFRKVANA